MKYKCDICGAEYSRASDAEDCERRHRNGGRLYCCVSLWRTGDWDWCYEVTRAEGIPRDDVFIRSVREYGVPAAVAWCEDLPEAIADVKARICREVLRRLETVARNLRETSGVCQEQEQVTCSNIEWLVSMGPTKAREFLDGFCPRQCPSCGPKELRTCEGCMGRYSKSTCDMYRDARMELVDWLFEAHEEKTDV